jgi:hypothetical protein
MSLKELIEYMAKSLVDDPSQVHVEEIEGTNATIYELRVGPEDMGASSASRDVWPMPCGPCYERPLLGRGGASRWRSSSERCRTAASSRIGSGLRGAPS